MDPPAAALAAASTLYEPQPSAAPPAAPPAAPASASSVDHLLFFDGFDEDAFPPLEAASNGLSVPAHEALMAFLTEMEALDRDDDDKGQEQQSNVDSSSDTAAVESVPKTIASIDDSQQVRAAGDGMEVAVEKLAMESKPKQPVTATRRGRRKTAAHATAEASGPKPEKKRIRAKQEIDMLREDAATLQRQLELIQSTATEKQKRDAEREAVLAETSVVSQPPKKPKLRHVSAVEQNRQLRKLVKTQLRYAKQIENVLMAKNHDDEAHSILISDNAVTQTPLSKADLVVFYEALTGKLDSLYAQLDNVFADAECQKPQKREFNDVKLVIDANKHATLQLRDVKTLPFSFEMIKDVSWRFLKAQSVKYGDGADEFLVADDDVMLMRRGLTVQLEEGQPQVEVPTRAVSKRFISKDHMVFCWDGTTDWPIQPKADNPGPQSVPLREKGWAVIKPVPGVPRLCTIQMCILMTPGVADERMYAQVTRQEIEEGMTKFVIPTYQQLFVSRYQMVENMLLDEQKR